MDDPKLLSRIAASIMEGYVGGITNLVPDMETSGEGAYYGWTSTVGRYATKLANIPLIGRIIPKVGNSFIYCRSSAGLRFDEQLEGREDVHFVGQMRGLGKVDFLDGTHVTTSGRRFREEGPVYAWLKRAKEWLEYSMSEKSREAALPSFG
jgi:hypothetical protein